jgi:anti-sigma regulatory factor (Ser/Thr protein kinase)
MGPRGEDAESRGRVFPARMAAFPEVAAFVAEACAAAGFDRPDCLRLTLVVEELFTNTVVHGHGGDSEEPVIVALDAQPGRVALTYEDTGKAYDAFSTVEAPNELAGVELRSVGGLGMVLIANMATHLAYSHSRGRNRISLVVSAASGS